MSPSTRPTAGSLATGPATRQPPRLVVLALAASFLTVAVILGAVFVLFSFDTQRRMRSAVAASLDAAQQVFVQVEGRRQQDLIVSVSTLAENPTLKAALEVWQLERRSGQSLDDAVNTVQREAAKIASRVNADMLAVTSTDGQVVAAAGPRAAAITAGSRMQAVARDQFSASDEVLVLPSGAFRVTHVPLTLDDTVIGSLALGTALDTAYANDLATLARAESAIVVGDRVRATSLNAAAAEDLQRSMPLTAGSSGVVDVAGESWAIRPVTSIGPATFYVLASVDAAVRDARGAAFSGLGWIGLAALALAALGSFWLARTLTQPIDQLSASLAVMTAGRDFDAPVPATGSSRELDALADAFNELIRELGEAEAETRAAYLGAIRALAAALDARDPYTAGHSERVSALSVEMGRAMQLPDAELETLRLGALLHDIGKIGVPDEVLRKPDALSPREFELIRAHPVIGARILRSIPFLAPHLPIVELHHERPDGHGYPYGLHGDAIPVAARIVHVADAYDAMTSARAYRPGRLPHEAIAELQRCVGSDFDGPSVESLVSALPRLPAASAGFDPSAFQWAAIPRPQAS